VKLAMLGLICKQSRAILSFFDIKGFKVAIKYLINDQRSWLATGLDFCNEKTNVWDGGKSG
jgi:hypothetical protein